MAIIFARISPFNKRELEEGGCIVARSVSTCFAETVPDAEAEAEADITKT